jgi:CBS domain-containing protein
MTDYGVKRLPVVNENGELIGIVTRADLVRAFARAGDEIEDERDQRARVSAGSAPGS